VFVTSVTVRVPAKINLQLAVGPLRPDGYHGLVTVFHAVSLFDDVTVTPAAADTVSVTGEGAAVVPADADNLALRAVRALRDAIARRTTAGARSAASAPSTAGASDAASGSGAVNDPEAVGALDAVAAPLGGVAVTIAKRIPVAGGMAGGSADAAAALVACNELWGTGLSQRELCAIAATVGSDAAFPILGNTAIGTGRGEQLTPVTDAAPATYHWVLALADGHLSTPTVFRTLDKQRAGRDVPEPELSNDLMAALAAGDAERLGAAIVNDLQEPALTLFPALRKTLDAGREAGALGALVSGSGPTCYFLARDEAHSAALAKSLSEAGVCRTVATATGPAAGASVVQL
jgi:4-diphosphocytidyl-2-C-methyl-D-erythritol kinase